MPSPSSRPNSTLPRLLAGVFISAWALLALCAGLVGFAGAVWLLRAMFGSPCP